MSSSESTIIIIIKAKTIDSVLSKLLKYYEITNNVCRTTNVQKLKIREFRITDHEFKRIVCVDIYCV